MAVERIHTYCAQSKSRCGVVCTVEDGVLKKVEADPEHPNACICVKGTAAPEIVYSPDRLRYPMRRTRPKGDGDPGWVRISWDEALDMAASRLLEIRARYGPEAVVFGRPAPGGSPANDYVGWLFRLANAFGSPNVMATTHICNWHKDTGSRYTYGVGIPSPDFENARCILLWGHNPHASWPAHALRISRARKRGAQVIVVDPRKVGVADSADLWLRVRPGADGALALAMLHVLLEEGLYDQSFVRDWTNAPFLLRMDTQRLLTEQELSPSGDAESFLVWDEKEQGVVAYRAGRGYQRDGVEPALTGVYRVTLADGQQVSCQTVFAALRELAAQYAPERSEGTTWVPASQVREAARMFALERPSCYYTYVGLEEHTNAMQTNRAVCLLYALTGQFDTRGSNVLFPRPPTNAIAGRELLPPEKAERRLGYRERPLGPAGNPGNVQAYEVYRAILEGEPYPVKAMVMFGGNPLLSNGDTLRGRAALKALDFYLHVDIFPSPSADFADLLLPACTSWECEAVKPTFEMAEDTSTWVQLRKAVISPLHESRPDVEIIFDLARRLGLADRFWDGDVEAAFNYLLQPSGITVQQLREHPVGVRVPATTRYRKYAEIDPKTGRPRGFQTPSARVEVYSLAFARQGYPPLPVYEEPAISPYSRPDLAEKYPLVLTMSKLVQFCHTQHRNIPRLRRQVPDPFLEVHPDTAARLGLEAEEWAVLETALGRVRLRVKFNSDLHPGVVSTQHGWWQGCEELGLPGHDPFSPEGSNVNLLIPNDRIDPISGSVPHRSYLCRVRPWRESG